MKSSKTWSILAGLLALLIGFVLLFWPVKTLVTVVWLFGIFALLYGFIRLGEGIFRRMEGSQKAWYLIGGITSILLGILLIAWPGATLLIIVWLIAIRAIIVGIMEMIIGLSDRDARMLTWIGVLNIIFGLVVFFFTAASVTLLVWLIAFYLIAIGIVEIATSFRQPPTIMPA